MHPWTWCPVTGSCSVPQTPDAECHTLPGGSHLPAGFSSGGPSCCLAQGAQQGLIGHCNIYSYQWFQLAVLLAALFMPVSVWISTTLPTPSPPLPQAPFLSVSTCEGRRDVLPGSCSACWTRPSVAPCVLLPVTGLLPSFWLRHARVHEGQFFTRPSLR